MNLIAGGLLDLEINDIIQNTNPLTDTVTYSIIIHTDERDIPILFSNSIDIRSNYNRDICDYVLVTFHIPAGDFIKDVYPKRDNLELTIVETSTVDNSSNKTRYKLALVNNTGNVSGSMYTKLTKEQLNEKEMFKVEGQCFLREIEVARGLYAAGVFKSGTVDKVMLSEFYNGFSGLKVEGSNINLQCNIAKPNNDLTYNHIMIPTGIKLLDIADYLQNRSYGVYNGAIGAYFTKRNKANTMYVYPLYDKERYDSVTQKLNIYYANTSKLNFIENTYKKDGDIVKIIAGSNIKSYDTGENEFIDTGDGVVMSDPMLLTRRNAIITDNDITVSKQSQLTAAKIKERKDGMSQQVYLGNEPNLYRYRSIVNKQAMAVYQLEWKFPNIDLLYPGMPTCFIYEDETAGIVKLKGVLQTVFSRYDFATKTKVALLTVTVAKHNI